MDENLRLERLISFSFFSFQTTDLAEIIRKAKDNECNPFHNLEENSDKVNTISEACFLGMLNLYESAYLLYAYKFRGKEYGFAWETYYDESHRVDDLDMESSWYDFTEPGQCFKIRIDKQDPAVHYIIERPFNAMNKTVIELGPCRQA